MQRFFILSFFLLFPLQLFASVGQTTMQYLAQAGNDPWVVMARAAVGEDAGSPAIARENVFALAKTILAFVATASGGAPHDAVVRVAGGSDLVNEFLQQHVHDGQIGTPAFLNDDFWGILALRAAGVPADHPALVNAKATIIRAQDSRGGWSWSALPDTPDTDDTAAAIMALLELGMPASDPVLSRAFVYLSAAQNADGGFPNVPPGVSSVDSTAWVVMALQKATASGGAPQNAVASRAQNFLQSQMRSDGSWGSPATTSFVAIALSGKWFPVVPTIARIDAAQTTARGPAASHPAPTASPSGLLGLERGPHSASPLVVTSPVLSKPPRLPESVLPQASTDLLLSLPTKNTESRRQAYGGQALLSVEKRTADSAILPIGFIFPSLVATSIFSKPRKVNVVHAAIDSDGDGYPDDVEIANGYNPHDPRPVKVKESKKHRNIESQKRKNKKQKITKIKNFK